jgi:F0F1-type ATP synthase alpha subunit
LERAGSIADKDGKAITITLMPIIETVGGDLTGYVQTNLISMSDGHTLFDLETFYKGIRPAVNIGLSVSRVGKQTQSKLQKEVASKLRTMLAEYGEAKNFVRFGAELTDKTKQLFLRGTIFEELIKQDLNTHLRIEEQLMVMLSLIGGFFDEVPLKQVVARRNVMIEEFRKADYDGLRQALKDSADEATRTPLFEAFYAKLPAMPTTGGAGTEVGSTEKTAVPAAEAASTESEVSNTETSTPASPSDSPTPRETTQPVQPSAEQPKGEGS